MKTQRVKDVLLGAVTVSLVVGGATSAFAKASKENISVSYNNIKLVVDGKTVNTSNEPFIYNGTTYLPVRVIGEALGKNVSWDGNTNTVTIGNSASNSSSTTTATSYSRTNPAPINTMQTYTKENTYSDTKYTVSLRVTETYRGSKAWEMIKAANMFNDEAPTGKEYIVAKIVGSVISSNEDKAVHFSEYNFTAFSGTNVEYDMASVVNPEPEFSGDVYTGGTTSGYCVFLVNTDDANPKIVYGQNYDGTGGVWFSLSK